MVRPCAPGSPSQAFLPREDGKTRPQLYYHLCISSSNGYAVLAACDTLLDSPVYHANNFHVQHTSGFWIVPDNSAARIAVSDDPTFGRHEFLIVPSGK